MRAEHSVSFPPCTVEVHNVVDPTWWNDLVLRAPGATIFQTAHWARFVTRYLKDQAYFLVAKDNRGEVTGTLLAFQTGFAHRVFFERPFDRLTIPALRMMLPVYYWSHGPLSLVPDRSSDVTHALIHTVDTLAQRTRAIRLEGEPLPLATVDEAGNDVVPSDIGLATKNWATLLVDLTPDEETRWRNLHHSARKAINRAQRDGIYVERVTTVGELREYYEFARACSSRKPGRFFSFANSALAWEELRPYNGIEIFVAKHEGRPIAGLGIWAFAYHITEFSSVQSQESYEQKLYGNDLIKWEVIQWGHAQGYRTYDLAGVAPEPANAKESGIRQFKEKWGGRYVPYFAYHKTYPGWRSRALELAQHLGRWILSRRGRR